MSSLYEITTTNAFVMKKPDDLSQVLGILNKGVQIDILNIVNDWGYFKYNNQDAYIRKNNLKVITTTPIENKGSLIIKYFILILIFLFHLLIKYILNTFIIINLNILFKYFYY